MHTNGLAKHYDALNPRERFVLMQAATMRDDTGEVRRLADAAKQISFSTSDFTPFEESWRLLEMAFIGDMMYECAAFWQAFYLTARHDDESDRLPELLFALGYRVVNLFDGWARFCEGTQIPAPGVVQQYGGWPFIVDTVETARGVAFTEAQMQGWLATAHDLDYAAVRVSTPSTKAAQYADAYAQLLSHWGRTL